MKTALPILLPLLLAAAAPAASVSFSESYTDQLKCESSDGMRFCEVVPNISLSVDATLRIPGLNRAFLEEWDGINVRLGGTEFRGTVGEAQPGSTQNRMVFNFREYDDEGRGRLVGSLQFSRAGEVATVVITHNKLEQGAVVENHKWDTGPFRNSDGISFSLQVGDLPEVTRMVYYGGTTSRTVKEVGSPEYEMYELWTVSASGEADDTPPEVSLRFPRAESVYRASDNLVRARINATDNVRVDSVWVSLNGMDAVQAEPDPESERGNPWLTSLELVPGQNTLRVFAVDPSGNQSAISTHKFSYVVVQPVTLVFDRSQGSVAGAADQQLLDVNKPYRLTARPAKNYFFSHWVTETPGAAPVTSTNPVLTCVMQTGLVVRANFVTNVFTGVAGTYNGLFAPTNSGGEAMVTPSDSGALKLTLTAKRGFSGRLQLAGVTHPFSGTANLQGFAQVVLRPANGPAIDLALQFDVDDDGLNEGVNGLVSRGDWVAELRAVPAVTGGRFAPLPGKYTLVLPGGPTESASTQPAGHGAATAILAPKGNLTLAGALADGTPLKGTLPVSAAGEIPVYRPLYKGKGLLWGWAGVSTNAPQIIAPVLAWVRPPGVPQDRLYPHGFTAYPALAGHSYAAPLAGGGVPGWSSTNGVLRLGGGNLDSEISIPVSVVGNRVVAVGANDYRLSLALTPRSGAVKGSFLPPGSKAPIQFQGVMTTANPGQECLGLGWFRGTTQSGYLRLEPQPAP